MTTVPIHTHDQDEPDPNEVIRVTVRALRSAHQVEAVELARRLGVSRQSIYNRLNGHAPWLAAEVAALADFFGCEVQDLYNGTVRIGPLTRRTPPPITDRVTGAVTPRLTRPCSAHALGTVIPFPAWRAVRAGTYRTYGTSGPSGLMSALSAA
jgi:DNA-binding XRE family transcriptional regulator